ncbi:MAG: 5'/3'-nucleotidase SurE [Bacteroidales bacterium]|nr:5'/3'-nucleotidase SurE [Bacteroidales bacterium]
MKPLILIGNDDGFQAKGLRTLIDVAREVGDVIVMCTGHNASAKSFSLTTYVPLRAQLMEHEDATNQQGALTLYATNGTPADTIKLGLEHFCPRRPDLMLSGINHGSNASINVVYSGTMGAALEAVINGIPAVGFSILEHDADADFSVCQPYIRDIVRRVVSQGIPQGVCLNVNFPYQEKGPIQGVKVCRAARAVWQNSYAKRTDPRGRDYFWMTGDFVCTDMAEDTDEWALAHSYVSVVPMRPDYTAHDMISNINSIINN